MLETLNFCLKNNKIVSLYDDFENTDTFLTGYISHYNESEVLINHIDPRGCYDGYILKHISEIFKIEYDSEYQIKIEKLYQVKSQNHSNINMLENGLLFSLIEFAIKHELIVCFTFQNSMVFGFIDNYNCDIINLTIINDYGFIDGKCTIMIDSVKEFCVDTQDEQDLKVLYNLNYKTYHNNLSKD